MSRTERLSHYGVLLIAITAVVVSVWQGRISQRQLEIAMAHNRLTVKPYLEITRFNSSSDNSAEITVRISNQGYGPAVVKSFELTHKETTYSNWNAVLDAAGESRNIRYLRNYSDGSVIAPGTEEVLIRISTEDFNAKDINVKIVYESIYQEEDEETFSF